MSTRRVSIISVTPEYPPNIVGGLGTYISNITPLIAKKMGIVVYTPGHRDTRLRSIAGVSAYAVSNWRGRPTYLQWLEFNMMTVALVNSTPADPLLVHVNDWMSALAGAAVSSVSNIPLVYSVHCPQQEAPKAELEDVALAVADRIVVSSKSTLEDVINRGVPRERVRLVAYGVDRATFHARQTSPTSAKFVLFVGRLVRQKGADLLLRAFCTLGPKARRWRLVLVGEGPERLPLEALASALGLSARVDFVGWQNGARLADLYRSAVVAAMPSRYEPFGMVALEAMACGCPVVASRVGGLKEVVADGESGYLVAPGDEADLSRRLEQVGSDDRLRSHLREGALKVASGFSWVKCADSITSIYDELAAKQSPERGGPLKTALAELGAHSQPGERAIVDYIRSALG
jgi:glycosyltransferase involved in cell wall biosynthesis